MDPIDAWLAGLVHHAVDSDPSERARHERFMVARLVAGAATLAVLPAYLLGRGVPTGIEALAIVALVAPVLSAVLLSRTGRLAAAQALASLALAAFAAAAGAGLGGLASAGALVLLIVPIDALFCASRRGLAAALMAMGLAMPAMVLVGLWHGITPEPAIAVATLLAVASTLTAGQAAAQALADRRLGGVVRTALRIGETREGATLQAIDDLVTWHDRNGNVLRANAAAG
jgi:cell cycle sensor histidine kinase DivJ